MINKMSFKTSSKRALIFEILFLIFISELGCNLKSNIEKDIPYKPSNWNKEIALFNSCAEITDYINSYRASRSNDSNIIPINDSQQGQHYQNQVDGVQEGDILQSSNKYYYFVRPGFIEIIDKNKLDLVKSLPINTNYFSKNIIINNDYLIFIGSNYSLTKITIYNVTDPWNIIREETLESDLVDYRIVENKLIFITQSYGVIPQNEDLCQKVYRPHFEDGSNQITYINIIDLLKIDTKAVEVGLMEGVNHFYMSQDKLFLFNSIYYDTSGMTPFENMSTPSYIKVIDLKSEAPVLTQVIPYDGIIKDRYSVLYNNEVLFLALTKRDKISFQNMNQVIAFKNEFNGEMSGAEKKFVFEGESELFGKMEDIRAVNYQKREQELYAYVVTFEKTDPLFVINISNPKQIKILSELKVPGFSTQLSSLKESLLLGIGYDAKADYGFSWFGGIKLSLFDLEDLSKPLELDYKIFGSRGSFSEATVNPKVLMRSKDLSALAFPLVVYTKSESQDPWVFGGQLEFAGVTIVNVTQQNTFLEKGRFSHSNWRIKYCGEDFSGAGMGGWWFGNNTSGDIQRIIEEQDRYITFSRFGVKAYQTKNLDLIMEVEFPNNDSSQCLDFNGTPRSQW